MELTGYAERQRLITWAEQVCAVATKRGDTHGAASITQEIADFRTGRFMLTVMGMVKRGKSTLTNAFLGRTDDLLAPVGKMPVSSAISKFTTGDEEKAVVYFRDGHSQEIGYPSIAAYVTEEKNQGNKADVSCVEVIGHFANLEKDLVFVDTPGASSIHAHHDAILHAILPQSDAVLFLVTARMPIAADELDLLKQLKAADIKKIFFAINKVDASEEGDIEVAVAHNLTLLATAGIAVDRIYRISAKWAMEGKLAQSGVPELMADVAKFVRENRVKVMHANFISRIARVAQLLAEANAVEANADLKSREAIAADLEALLAKKEAIHSSKDLAIMRFNSGWGKAIAGFNQGLLDVKASIGAKIVKKIHGTGTLGVKDLAHELPSFLNQLYEQELGPLARDFETQTQAAVNDLQVECPRMSVTGAGEVVVRPVHDTTLIKGAAVAVGGVIVGGGTMAAGGAVVAAVAATNAAAIAATAAANAAALAAASSTVAIPTAVTGFVTWLGGLGGTLGSELACLVAPLTTATTTVVTGSVTVATPTLATAPVWAVFAGPIGWTLMGVGLLAVPLAYRISRKKLQGKLDDECMKHHEEVFNGLREQRLPALRHMGELIANDYSLRLDNELYQLEAAIRRALARKDRQGGAGELTNQTKELGDLIATGKNFASVLA